MPIFRKESLTKEYVTPKYSRAYGGLATGASIEVGELAFADGEGAVEHQHPQEQMMYVVSGTLRVEMQGETQILRAGDLAHMPSGVPHKVTGIEGGAVVLSSKNTIDGRGHRI